MPGRPIFAGRSRPGRQGTQRYAEIIGDPAYIEGILRRGVERVLPIAQETLRRVKEASGLG